MNRVYFTLAATLAGLSPAIRPVAAAADLTTSRPAVGNDEIVAALPVIPDAKFNLIDLAAWETTRR